MKEKKYYVCFLVFGTHLFFFLLEISFVSHMQGAYYPDTPLVFTVSKILSRSALFNVFPVAMFIFLSTPAGTWIIASYLWSTRNCSLDMDFSGTTVLCYHTTPGNIFNLFFVHQHLLRFFFNNQPGSLLGREIEMEESL